jgi:transposase
VLLRMDAQIQTLTERAARQDERIAQLERRLNRSSRNSSLPASQDPSSAPVRRSRDSSGRPRGGQAGHEGHGRELLPSFAVDEAIEHWPRRCGCGRVFTKSDRVPVGKPARFQVEELPEITVRVTEHRCPRVRCPDCGRHTRAELPAELARSAFGARLQAAVTALSVRGRISRRDTAELVEELFGHASARAQSIRSWPAPVRPSASPTRTCTSASASLRR